MKKILSFCIAVLCACAMVNAADVNLEPGSKVLYNAVPAASAGDVLILADGVYEEPEVVELNKNLTIKAAEGAKPVIAQQYYMKLLSGAQVTFIGIKFDGGLYKDGQGANDHCIRPYDDSADKTLTLIDCEFCNWKSYILYPQRANRCMKTMTLQGCYFHDNQRGAIYVETGSSDPCPLAELNIENTTFNGTPTYKPVDLKNGGTAVADAKLRIDHCTFYNCGPVRSEQSTDVIISNSIFAAPEATYAATVCYGGEIKNCLVYNVNAHQEGPTVTGEIAADPKFEDAANGIFYLADDSPARNAGTDSKTLGDQRWWEKPKLAAPDAAPAAPEWPAKQVKAVYSATYNADCGFGEWGSGTVYTQEDFGKKYVTTNLGYFGMLFEGDNALNCSKMEKLHLDIWVAADTALRVVPIWKAGGAEKGVWATLKGQQWNAIDIALTEYDNVTDWSNIYQIKLDEIREQTFWVNNVYFYTTIAPPVDNDAPTNFTAEAGEASYFSAQIKAKATDASEGVQYDVINGELIVATAKAASDAEAIITVKGLKPGTEYNLSVVAKDEDGNAAEPIAVTVKTLDGPAAAAAPEYEPEKVKSIYSDAYTFAPASLNSYNEGWWSWPVMSEGELAAGDKALFYAKVTEGMIGWQFGEIDVTNFPYLHIDIYPLADGSIEIYPVNNTEPKGEYKGTYNVKGNQWNTIVIDLKDKDLTKIFQIGWINYVALNGFFIDNVYFAATPAPIKPQPNIYASSIKGVVSDDGTQMYIEYLLNADATEVEVEFFEDDEIVAKISLSNDELLTVGKHQTTISLPLESLEEGTYSWALHAYGNPTEFKNLLKQGDPRYSFYLPQDVVVDNSFESDYFGRVYLSMPWEGESDGGSETTKVQKRGLYYYEPTMDKVNGTLDVAQDGFDGGLGGAVHSRNGIKRLAIDDKGFVYVASRDEETKGVYRADPNDLTKPFETILSASAAVDALEVADGKLYTVEGCDGGNNGFINVYKMDAIPVGEPSKQFIAPEKLLANSDITIRSDHRGGFWATQHRYALDVWGALIHYTSGFDIDFVIASGSNDDLLSNADGGLSYRGTLGVSVDGNKVAVSSNRRAVVFDIAWGDDGVPTLTKNCETPKIGSNIDGIAFDIADNMYVASASAEEFHMYPLAKEEGANHSRAYAASKYNIIIKSDAVDNVSTKVAPAKVLRDGQVLIIRDGVEYNVLGNAVK